MIMMATMMISMSACGQNTEDTADDVDIEVEQTEESSEPVQENDSEDIEDTVKKIARMIHTTLEIWTHYMYLI